MKFEDTPLNEKERETAQKWMTKHQATCQGAAFEYDSVVGGYGYRLKVVCTTCGTREDVTDMVKTGGYPHK